MRLLPPGIWSIGPGVPLKGIWRSTNRIAQFEMLIEGGGHNRHAERKIILPSPTRALRETEGGLQRLIAELKRLALKHGYTHEQIASGLGVSPITVDNWWTGYSLTGQRESVERLKKFLAAH